MTTEPRKSGMTIVFDLIIEFYATDRNESEWGIEFWRPKLKQPSARNRAVVYGAIYRYSKMSEGYCFESLENMATEIGMGRYTLKKHLDALVSDGWIDCLFASSGGRNIRSSYAPSLKLDEMMSAETLSSREGIEDSIENTLSSQEGIEPKPSHELTKPSHELAKPSHSERRLKETIGNHKETIVKETNSSASKKNLEHQKLGVNGIHRDELARREAAKKYVRPAGTIKERIAADKQNARPH